MSAQQITLYPYKLLIIGDTNVGKSNVVLRFVKDTFTRIQPTVGVQYATKIVELPARKVKVKAQIWDTAGMQRYKAICSAHYRRAAGAFLVYDITDRSSFLNLGRWLEELKANSESDIIIMLLGHKLDLMDQRTVARSEGIEFAKRNGLIFLQTSAVEQFKHTIKEAFQILLDTIHVYSEGMKVDPQRVKLTSRKKAELKCCI